MNTEKQFNFQLLVNPFIRIAGIPALSFGMLFMIVGAMLAGFFNARFDGALDLHFNGDVVFSKPLTDQLLIWISLVTVFYPIALILGAKPRFIDMAGTLALSRFAFVFAPLVNAGHIVSDLTNKLKVTDMKHPVLAIEGSEMALFILLSLLTIVCAVWLVALYFNAWKTCTNLKGRQLLLSFIGGLIASEVLSIYLIRNLFN